MILTLYGFLVAVSLVLIVLGLSKPSESQLALIGFFFMFLLGLTLLQGSVQYETGANMTTTLSYGPTGDINQTDQYITYNYQDFDDNTSHNIGLYLAIGSGVGFAGVLFGLAKTNWRRE